MELGYSGYKAVMICFDDYKIINLSVHGGQQTFIRMYITFQNNSFWISCIDMMEGGILCPNLYWCNCAVQLRAAVFWSSDSSEIP